MCVSVLLLYFGHDNKNWLHLHAESLVLKTVWFLYRVESCQTIYCSIYPLCETQADIKIYMFAC